MDAGLSSPVLERGGLVALGALLRKAGRQRIFVICGPSARHLDRIQRQLDGMSVEVFREARRHVPEALVARAAEALAAFGGDAVISIGGGSTTGLAKALRLTRSFFFVAIPTTYAGSELTDLYGTTSEGGKRTGRDLRVVPDVVLYDVSLTLDMPLTVSITSLLNALAHPLSALSTGKLDAAGRQRALAAAEAVYRALDALARAPRDEAARRAALEGTILAGLVLRTSAVGVHHQLAHALGGRFDLDHAGLHSVLLPHSTRALREAAPAELAELEQRLGEPRLALALFTLLRASGAPTSLAALGATREGLEQMLDERPELPRVMARAAFAGAEPAS